MKKFAPHYGYKLDSDCVKLTRSLNTGNYYLNYFYETISGDSSCERHACIR